VAAEIEQELGLVAELRKGSGGILEVRLNDELVFSKKQVGRFPLPGEVVAALRPKLAV
jgi:selenoprotein W-related protein